MNRAIRVYLSFTLAFALLLPLSAHASDYQNFPSYMDNGVKARYNPNLKAANPRENPLRQLMKSNSGQLGIGQPTYTNSYSSDVQGRAISLSNVPPSKSAMAYNQYRALPAQKYVRPVAVIAARSNPLTNAVNNGASQPPAPAATQSPAPVVQAAPPRTQTAVVTQQTTTTQSQSAPPREPTVVVTRPSPPAPRTEPPSVSVNKSNMEIGAD